MAGGLAGGDRIAFGISREFHDFVQVLFFENRFPYDMREVVDSPNGPVPGYTKTKRRRASTILRSMVKG